MTISIEKPTINDQISQLEAEILQRNADIRKLTAALATLEANQPRPADPSCDDAFALLRELVGNVPQQLEERQVYAARLAAAKESLSLSVQVCGEKQQRLDALRQQKREQQQEQALERLKSKAAAFNNLIDSAMAELQEMRSLSKVAGSGTLEIVADPNETPYCHITAKSVKLRRRFDVLRG
jgi:DNA repair exonuclease SbcCD ATPase subunit